MASPPSSARPALLAGLVGAVLAVAWLLGPRTGTDLAAQTFRADFAHDHPLTPVDLRWFSGTQVFGYSLWTPAVMAWIGVRVLGVISAVLVSAQTAELFRRTGARRPLVGGVLAALLQITNLIAGRVTFAAGLVFALAVLLVLARPRGESWVPEVVVAGFLCGAASPVAALFLWLAGGVLVLRRRFAQGITTIVVSAVPTVGAAVLFGSGGVETFSGSDAAWALVATGVVLVVVPLRPVEVRIGAGLGIVMVLVAFLVDTPVGNNAIRLSLLFAVPVVAAYVSWRPWLAAVAVIACALPQQIMQKNIVNYTAARDPSYAAPLIAELHRRGPVVGRLEVPETGAHWDAAWLARDFPLARGWLRQTDVDRNRDVFFTDRAIPPATYRVWLAANSVTYVAVPDAPLTDVGTNEADLVVRHTPAYLAPVWHDAHWRLYAVRGFTPVVRAPGRTVRLGASEVVLRAPARRVVPVQVRWSRWLSLDGPGCITRSNTGDVTLRTARSGEFILGSRLVDPDGHC